MIREYRFPAITTSGVDGSAAGDVTSAHPIIGRVLAIHIDYSAGQAATTDVVIASVHAPVRTILTRSNSATDGWFQPAIPLHDDAAAAVTYDGTNEIYTLVPVNDQIKVTVAEADDTETVTVTLLYEE